MEVFGEGFDVLVEGLFYVFEDWEAPGEVVERGVGGVAGEVVVVAPLLAGFVILSDGEAGVFKLGGVDLIREGGLVEGGVEEVFHVGLGLLQDALDF